MKDLLEVEERRQRGKNFAAHINLILFDQAALPTAFQFKEFKGRKIVDFIEKSATHLWGFKF